MADDLFDKFDEIPETNESEDDLSPLKLKEIGQVHVTGTCPPSAFVRQSGVI
jgi:hypothetical protein